MAQQNLNTGTTPNDGSGDSLRCAFIKTETNFADLYSCIGGIDTSISNINSCLTGLDDSTDQFELFSWGTNSNGQLGTNNTICYSVPTQEVCGGTTWCMVSLGNAHTLAIKTDGTLWSWGFDSNGQLGINNKNAFFGNGNSIPTQEFCGGTNWCMASGSYWHSLAIKTDGTLWSWGRNAYGQLGLNNVTCYSTPQQEVCGGTTWCMVNGGDNHTSAIKTDGTLWSMGNNTFGQLGTNNCTLYSTPTQEHCGGTTWCMVSAGSFHNSAIKTDGTLWSWGVGNDGRLGLNNRTNYSTPTQEHCGGTTWCMVSAGGNHTSAIKTDGTLWSWGSNFYGQLGTNNRTCYSTPQQEVCGGTNWYMVSSGTSQYTTAIKTDGTLWGWGLNSLARLGTNNTTCYSTPQQEACGGTNWCMVSAGSIHTSAIRID